MRSTNGHIHKGTMQPQAAKNFRKQIVSRGPLENEFDLIKAKCWGVNELVNVMLYTEEFDKDEVELLTMQKQISLVAEFGYHFFEGRTIALR